MAGSKRTRQLNTEATPLVTDFIPMDRAGGYTEARKITVEQLITLAAASLNGVYVSLTTYNAAIGAINSNISGLQTQTNNNSTDIATLASQVGANSTAIGNALVAIGINTADIAALAAGAGTLRKAYLYDAGNPDFVYDPGSMLLIYNLNAADKAMFKYDGNDKRFLIPQLREKYTATRYRNRNSFDAIVVDDGTNYTSIEYEGIDADLLTRLQIILT